MRAKEFWDHFCFIDINTDYGVFINVLTARLQFKVPNSIHPTYLLNKFPKFASDKKQMSITNQTDLNVKGYFKPVS